MNWIEVQSNETNVAHIAAHLPLELREVSPWLPDRRAFPEARWSVMRQDDNGNTFEISQCTSRCEADIRVAAFEALGHKQTYWVAERSAR